MPWSKIFSFWRDLLSFFVAVRQQLDIPRRWDGDLWHYRNLGRRHAMHRHVELELNLITRGSGVYLLAKRKYRLGRGDLLWLFPEQEHVLVEQSLDFEMWIGVFRPRLVREIARDADARVLRASDPDGNHCRRLAPAAFGRMESLCAEVSRARDQAARFNAGLGHALASAWHDFRHAREMPGPKVHPAVAKAAQLIQHEANPPPLEKLATQCGLSSSRLSRLFKQQTGVALVDFRSRQRIERFLALHHDTHRPKLLDAALEAGFGSYAQFHRVFKRVMGCSPRDYRQQREETASG